MNNFNDFHTVKNLKFDIKKLQEALKQVLKIKKFDDANGVKYFAAICLNQIPGKPESISGNDARGVYWTKPDNTGKEAIRDKMMECSSKPRGYLDYVSSNITWDSQKSCLSCPQEDCLIYI